MSSNLSNEGLTDESKMEIFRHSIYIIEGFLIVLFNGMIIATIVRHDAIRFMKEYTILGAQALPDALSGLGLLIAGIYRIPLWLSHQDMIPASGRFCLLKAYNVLWSWSVPAQHGMLTIVSIDRVLSVAIPLKYFKFSQRYALALAAIPYSLALVGSAVIYIINWDNIEPIYTEICWSSQAYGMAATEILFDGVANLTSFGSILIYILTPILYWKQTTQVSNNDATNSNIKFQKQLNKAVAVTCMFTFIFVCCPFLLRLWFVKITHTPDEYEKYAVWMTIVTQFNPLVNLFVYVHRQTCFKVGVKALLKNKTLPPNLRNWPTTA